MEVDFSQFTHTANLIRLEDTVNNLFVPILFFVLLLKKYQ